MSVHKEKRGTHLPNQKNEKNEKKKKKSLTSLPNKSLTTTKGYSFFSFFFPSFSFWLYPKHKSTHQRSPLITTHNGLPFVLGSWISFPL